MAIDGDAALVGIVKQLQADNERHRRQITALQALLTVVTELDEVVKVTAHGPCPECADDRPLVRL